MAGKKGGAVLLQTEVNNEEDWENLLKREGLIVVDVYSEWCGPCLGMVGNLKKLKLELGSDFLHLATAKSDSIKVLERFRNKSEPTWMFIGGGRLVRVTFGANAPRLIRLITQELDKELKAIKGEVSRSAVPFEVMTDEEKVRANKLAERLEAERLKEEREIAQKLEELKIRLLTKLARKVHTHTLTMYFPHMIEEEKKTCNAAFKMLHQYDTVGLMILDQQEIALKEEDLSELFYNSPQVFPPKFYKTISKRPCLVTLLLSLVGGSDTSIDEFLGIVEDKLSDLVYGPEKNPNKPAANTPAANFLTEVEDEVWPGLWTPVNYLSKAAAMRTLFPSVIRALGYEDDNLPPPRFIMIFEATKAKEIQEVAKEYASEVLKVGFFDSVDPESAKKVCNKYHDLHKLIPEKLKTTKMVMSVAKRTSDPLLALSQLGPIYISPDVKTGTKEADTFFPPEAEESLSEGSGSLDTFGEAGEGGEGGEEAEEEETGDEGEAKEEAGVKEGETQEGEPQEGERQEGELQGGEHQEGEPQEGELQEGQPQEVDMQEGGVPQEDVPQEGELMEVAPEAHTDVNEAEQGTESEAPEATSADAPATEEVPQTEATEEGAVENVEGGS